MDFESAYTIGSQGETRVSMELGRLADKYGFQTIDNVLLDLGQETAQLDHVLVDMYGVVIVETKVRQGALIKGLDAEKKWTACYPGGKHSVFQNPLQQNRQHEAVLRKTLRSAAFLTPDHVKGCVVIIGASLDALELGSLERSRVFDVEGIEPFLRERHDYASAAPLTPEQQTLLAGVLGAMNRSHDPYVLERHARNAGAHRMDRRASTFAPRRPAAKVAARTTSAQTARAVSRGASRRGKNDFRELLAIAVTIGVLSWLWLGGGLGVLAGVFAGNLMAPAVRSVSSPSAAGTGTGSNVPAADVARARGILREAEPRIFKALAEPNKPKITSSAGLTTYTWHYLQQTSSRSVVEKTISLTVDGEWAVRRVQIP